MKQHFRQVWRSARTRRGVLTGIVALASGAFLFWLNTVTPPRSVTRWPVATPLRWLALGVALLTLVGTAGWGRRRPRRSVWWRTGAYALGMLIAGGLLLGGARERPGGAFWRWVSSGSSRSA